MFESTLELVTSTASSSLFVFCFCNLIIVIIILVGSKPSSNFDHQSEIPIGVVTTNPYTNYNQDMKTKHVYKEEQEVNESMVVSKVSKAKKEISDEGKSNNKDIDEKEDNDDKLRRRVEEFIERVNRGWKAELMRNKNLV